MKITKDRWRFKNRRHCRWDFWVKNEIVAHIFTMEDKQYGVTGEKIGVKSAYDNTFPTLYEAKMFVKKRLISTAKSLEKAANQIK